MIGDYWCLNLLNATNLFISKELESNLVHRITFKGEGDKSHENSHYIVRS